MSLIPLLFCQAVLAQAPVGKVELEHAQNDIYQAVCTVGLKAEGAVATLAGPLLRDGMSGEEQRTVLLDLAGSTEALDDFLAPGVYAPFKSKPHDWTGTAGTIRGFNIYFALHAKLDEIKSEDIDGQVIKGGDADEGNIGFEGRLLEEDELKTLGLKAAGKQDRFGQMECAILRKVEAKMVNRSLGTRSGSSLLVATQTILTLPAKEALRNAWRAVQRRGGEVNFGPWQPYSGVIAYTKVTRLDFCRDILFVEIHGGFAEPEGWFGGKTLLKSKISAAAKDKIPKLRREIIKRREKAARPAS